MTLVEKLTAGIEPTKDEIKDLIATFETEMLTQEQIEIPVVHHFSKGVYARQITIPKHSLVVGKIHKFENLNILSQGDITVLSVDGMFRVKAPYTVVSSPGVKRLAFTHEETVWTTIHGTDEKDVDKIEEEFIAKSYDEVVYCLDAKPLLDEGI